MVDSLGGVLEPLVVVVVEGDLEVVFVAAEVVETCWKVGWR